MRKLWLIGKREYLTRVKTRSFVITTISLPLLFIGIFIFSAAMARRQTDRTVRIAILDGAGGLGPQITEGLTRKLPSGQPASIVVKVFDQPESEDKVREELRAQVRRGELDGYVIVSKEAVDGKAVEFYTKNPGDFSVASSIRQAASLAVISRRLNDRGVHIDDLNKVIKGLDLKLVTVTDRGETEEKGQTFLAAIIMAAILYTTLIMYGVFTMRSVLEEKTTRIMEILVASVKPFQLLAGKILGLAAVALTQYLIWTVSAGVLAAYGTAMVRAFSPGARPLPVQIPVSTLAYLVIFSLAGYFLYASLYASVGAMVSSEEDAQQLQWPVTLPLVASFLLFNVILRDPNSTLSVGLSMIPFCAPILMVLRIALQTPPFWQIALSLVLMALTTLGVVYLSAKIYQVGVLMYGKRPSLAEVFRWLRYT